MKQVVLTLFYFSKIQNNFPLFINFVYTETHNYTIPIYVEN